MANALVELAKSFVARPVKPIKQQPNKIHWTRFNKPLDKMTEVERKEDAERLADEMLGVIKEQEK
jgi:hypothetical protein